MVARRKIDLQDIDRTKIGEPIDDLVRSMGTANLGFSPTDQVVYEIDLDRINPDFLQPRYFLPSDLREELIAGELTPREALRVLLNRAEEGDKLASLIIGGRGDVVDEEGPDDDRGLMTLARSIETVGLRQPINVYSITKPDAPGESFYQIGEGERRYWAHHLLVLQGNEGFSKIRCIIEVLPDDQDLIHRRQQAENAARQDLSAVARARAIGQIQDRLRIELGTRVPGETTIKLPGQRELDTAVGQEVKGVTGRAISGRMVRNYLRLLKLPSKIQDLAEAAQLTEKQLRPIPTLKTEAEQYQMVMQIIDEKLSGRAVLSKVAKSASPPSSLKRVTRTTVEQRLEKRLLQTAMTVHEVLSLGEDTYTAVIQALTAKMGDQATREALLAMRRMIDELVSEMVKEVEGYQEVSLSSILPPLDFIQNHLPESYKDELAGQALTGRDALELLLDWRYNDPMVASVLDEFFAQIENYAERIRAREIMIKPTLQKIKSNEGADAFIYKILTGKTIYWAHLLLVLQGNDNFQKLAAEIVN
jgi:ParB-like chromosome segregation protein Spo0J